MPSAEIAMDHYRQHNNISYNSGNVGYRSSDAGKASSPRSPSNSTAPIGIDDYGGNAPDIRFRRARINAPLDTWFPGTSVTSEDNDCRGQRPSCTTLENTPYRILTTPDLP